MLSCIKLHCSLSCAPSGSAGFQPLQEMSILVPLPLQEAALLGFLSFLMSMVVLSFFARVLLDIVDAVFFCYAIDKDSHTVTREEVHEVFSQVQHVLHGCSCLQQCTALHCTAASMSSGSEFQPTDRALWMQLCCSMAAHYSAVRS